MDAADILWWSLGISSVLLSIVLYATLSRWLDRRETFKNIRAGHFPKPMTEPPPPQTNQATLPGPAPVRKMGHRVG